MVITSFFVLRVLGLASPDTPEEILEVQGLSASSQSPQYRATFKGYSQVQQRARNITQWIKEMIMGNKLKAFAFLQQCPRARHTHSG